MKKYLITSAAALALCGLITSCTHELDYEASVQSSVVKKYEDAFVTAFGKPDPNQEWGFGTSVATSRAMTRDIDGITKPTFSDKVNGELPITEPNTPPTFYTTFAQVQAANIPYVGEIDYNNGWENVTVAYLDANSNKIRPDRSQGRTYYINGDVKYWNGFSSGDVTIVVLENSTLHMGCTTENLRIYLAPNAKVDFTKTYSEHVISYWPPESEILESDYNDVVTINKSGSLIYLSEGSEVKGNNLNFFDGCQILNKGGKISAKNISVDKNSTLWNEGTVRATEKLKFMNENALMYNAEGDSIIVGDSLVIGNSGDLLYNDGYLSVSGAIALQDGTAELINAAKLNTTGGLKMSAHAKFHNADNSVATLGGKVYIENSDCRWMNDGFFTCTEFEVTGGTGNPFVFNNCRLTVNGLFHMNHGYFVLDGGATAGAAVVCNSFTWTSDNFFMMGNKSLLRVKGQLLGANRNSDPHYGFHGLGDIAVIEAGSVEKDSEGKYRIAYYGNLYIDTKNHFEQGQASDGPWYYHDSTVKFSFTDEKDEHVVASAAPTIPGNEQSCNPGYNNEKPSSSTVRVICEDLSVTQASDWDFNDVVFDVQLMNENTQVKITFLAAGGTLPLTVAGEEVHGLFKEANPSLPISQSSMINTGSTGDKYTFRNCEKAYLTINNTFGSNDVKTVAKLIPVQVYKLENDTKTWVTMECKKGDPAAKIAVDTDYNWCDERTPITDKFTSTYAGVPYPNFNLYVKGILGDDWYNSKEITYEQKEAYLNR